MIDQREYIMLLVYNVTVAKHDLDEGKRVCGRRLNRQNKKFGTGQHPYHDPTSLAAETRSILMIQTQHLFYKL